MADNPLPGYWTVDGAARVTGLHPDTIRYHCRTGTLKAVLVGRSYMIPDAELDRFIADRNTRKATL